MDASGEMMRVDVWALADQNSLMAMDFAAEDGFATDGIGLKAAGCSRPEVEVFENRIVGGGAISADERQRPH